MSENEYHHHAEQMEAARREFQDFWKDEKKCHALEQSSSFEMILCETVGWRVWLKAKGLSK